MATDDLFYSLQDSDDKVFYKYGPTNSYVVPYSSDNIGGERITEYNQRAALNTMLLKERQDYRDYAYFVQQKLNETYGTRTEVDPLTGETGSTGAGLNSFKSGLVHNPNDWYVRNVYATGTQTQDDFELSINNSRTLKIGIGKALIYGYFIDAAAEITIDCTDILTDDDIRAVAHNTGQNPDNPFVSAFVKLAVMFVQAPDNNHDQRLNPPASGIYKSVAIVINEDLPLSNELLLGTISRDTHGLCFVTNNTLKTRIMPINNVSGAEDYSSLVNASDIEDGVIYGILKNSSDNLTAISKWLWLHEQSNLSKLLKIVSVNPETAGTDTDRGTRGIIVTPSTAATGQHEFAIHVESDKFPYLWWCQAWSTMGAATGVTEIKDAYIPFAYTNDGIMAKHYENPTQDGQNTEIKRVVYDDNPELANVSGQAGLVTPQQIYMLEKAYKRTLHENGHMFGPFESVADALNWFNEVHPPIQYGDYFWVVNDESVTITESGSTSSLANVVTKLGSVTGSVSGSVSGSTAFPVTGSTPQDWTGTANIGGTTATVTMDAAEITGNGQGNISGTVKGQIVGELTSFTQNVSARYRCIFPSSTQVNRNVANITVGVSWQLVSGVYQIEDKYPTHTAEAHGRGTGLQTDCWFVLEAVERGFAIPASSDTYGLIKTGLEGSIEGVHPDANNRLRVTDALIEMVKNGGYETSTNTTLTIQPNSMVENWCNKKYVNGLTISLVGNASDFEIAAISLHDIRGHITIDYTGVYTDTSYTGSNILSCTNVDYVTLVGDNAQNSPTNKLKLAFDHCVVDKYFFENIGTWIASQFVSGSNTLELDSPWMQVPEVFTTTAENFLYTKFSSITMGEHGIESAMLDMWIQHEGWSDNNMSIDKCWVSTGRINFPPFWFEKVSREDIDIPGIVNKHNIQKIPSKMNLKVSGTAGVHQIWNKSNSSYQTSGNLLVNVDWEYNGNAQIGSTPAGKLNLNLYMKNSSGDASQRFSNLRFRMPVQIIQDRDNAFAEYSTYEQVYDITPEE